MVISCTNGQTTERLLPYIDTRVGTAASITHTAGMFGKHTEEYGQTQAPQDASEYYTIRQLAEKWGVSIATIWRHEKLGHIKGQRIGRRVLFPKEQIDRIKNLKATNREADKNAKKENGKGTPTNE